MRISTNRNSTVLLKLCIGFGTWEGLEAYRKGFYRVVWMGYTGGKKSHKRGCAGATQGVVEDLRGSLRAVGKT